jgi:hypothetical protein
MERFLVSYVSLAQVADVDDNGPWADDGGIVSDAGRLCEDT